MGKVVRSERRDVPDLRRQETRLEAGDSKMDRTAREAAKREELTVYRFANKSQNSFTVAGPRAATTVVHSSGVLTGRDLPQLRPDWLCSRPRMGQARRATAQFLRRGRPLRRELSYNEFVPHSIAHRHCNNEQRA